MTNTIILAGRLTADAELKHTKNGSTICNFNLANNRKEASGEETTFIGVAIFGNYAEKMHPHLVKGTTVNVVGKLVQKNWLFEGRNIPMYKIYAKEIDFRTPKNTQVEISEQIDEEDTDE